MQTGRYRNVPLVDDDGRLVGVVRQTDILKYLAESFPEELLNLPPRPHQRMKRAGRRRDDRPRSRRRPEVQELERVTIRFAGDSGDGMQLTGTQFTRTAAVFGNDISTLPDFPAEIRAPAGSLPGVCGFQISFSLDGHPHPGRRAGRARGDEPGRAQDEHRRPAGGRRAHRQQRRVHARPNLNKAGYAANPLTDGSLKPYTRLRDPDLARSTSGRSRGSR